MWVVLKRILKANGLIIQWATITSTATTGTLSPLPCAMTTTTYAVGWCYNIDTNNTGISKYYGNFKCIEKNTTSIKWAKEDCEVTIFIIGY